VPASRDASSSDLNRARETSRRLSQLEAGAPPPRDASARFSASQVTGVPTPPPGAGAAAVTPPPAVDPRSPGPLPARVPPLPAATTFEARTAWCREALGAESVFLLDERGLLVASAGSVAAAEAEGVGARVVFTFEQADAMRRGSDRTRSICVEFGSGFLTAWRFPAEGIVLTVCVVTPKPLAPGAAAIVARAYASLARRAP
jgi:hypothetical protein